MSYIYIYIERERERERKKEIESSGFTYLQTDKSLMTDVGKYLWVHYFEKKIS